MVVVPVLVGTLLRLFKLGMESFAVEYFLRSCNILLNFRAQVNALLTEIPQRRLPLFKFRELYEQRYTTSVALF